MTLDKKQTPISQEDLENYAKEFLSRIKNTELECILLYSQAFNAIMGYLENEIEAEKFRDDWTKNGLFDSGAIRFAFDFTEFVRMKITEAQNGIPTGK